MIIANMSFEFYVDLMDNLYFDTPVFDVTDVTVDLSLLENFSLDHQSALNGYVFDEDALTILSASAIVWSSGGYTTSLTGSGISPVGTLDELDQAIRDGIATGGLDAITIDQGGTTIMEIGFGPNLGDPTLAYSVTSGNQQLLVNGTLPTSVDDLSDFVELSDRLSNISFLDTAGFDQLISDLRDYNLQGISLRDNGTELLAFQASESSVSLSLVDLDIEITGSFPDSFGALAEFVDFAVQLESIASLSPAERQAIFDNFEAYNLQSLTVTNAGDELFAFNASSTSVSVSLQGYTLTVTGELPQDLGRLVEMIMAAEDALADNQELTLDLFDGIGNGLSFDTLTLTDADSSTLLSITGLDALDAETPIDLTLNGTSGHDYIAPWELFGFDGYQLNSAGGTGNDYIEGSNGKDTLDGGRDNDTLYGGDNDDALVGGTQEDRLYGEDGNDTLYGNAGFDQLEGGIGNDVLDGGDQADNLLGGEGDDTLLGGNGFDRLFGQEGDDLLYGGNTFDSLYGQEDNDRMFGQSGNDGMWGGQGNDFLDGGSDNDRMIGGAGFDTLLGSTGNDTMIGAFNADTFIFSDFGGGFGQDIIEDFDANNDFEKIDLSRVSGIADFNDLVNGGHMATSGANVVINDGSGNTITLLNVSIADLLDGNDFIF